MDTVKQEVMYNPSSLMNIFNNALSNEAVRKTFAIRGRYVPGKGVEYNGYYYDSLKDETSEASMSFVVPSLLRHTLQPDQTIECHAYLTKKVQLMAGRIDLQLNLIDIVSQQQTAVSNDELRAISLLQAKAQAGYRDVDSFIKNKIINDQKIKVVIITGKTGIVDSDIKHQLKEAIALYDFEFVRVSLMGEVELIQAIKRYSNHVDIICLSRGGGENLEFFNKPNIAEAVIALDTLFISAIGHKEDITLLQKVADKAFITPTALGQYFHDIYSHTIEELQESKAKLVEQISAQLKANYDKQIQNLTEKLAASQQLFEKSKEENRLLHAKELEILKKQIEIFRTQHQNEVESIKKLGEERERFAKQQIEEMRLQKVKPPFRYGWAVVAGAIILLIIYLRACGTANY